jgi:release factor glutamine methyltransferase
MTVLEVIQRGTDYLARKGVDSPRLQVELLLAQGLEMQRLNLYLKFEREVPAEVLDKVRALVRRRGNREPLQHLLGTASFCGREFAVNPEVLIPRPETELLAEAAVEFLAAGGDSPQCVLDFGTGSGCLAVTVAVRCPQAEVHALDISPAAVAMARRNADRHGVGSRITFHAGDGYAALLPGLRFRLVVANPPYIPTAEIALLAPEVRDHDPHQALDGGADGLAFYRRLAVETSHWLLPGGRLLMEVGDEQAGLVADLLRQAGDMWIVEPAKRDYSGRPRFLSAAVAGHANEPGGKNH